MKRTLFSALIAGVLAAAPALAADYTVDQAHTHVGFTIKHMVSKVKGEFKDFDGAFNFDPSKPDASQGKFVVKTASISTNNQKRDDHLRSPEFFDVKKFPEMTLANLKLEKNGENKFKMTGDLTLHGVTKPVVFETEFNGTTKDPWGMNRAGFSATAQINREDFGIVWNKTLEAGGLLLGKDVGIDLQVEAIEGKPAEAKKDAKAENKAEAKKSGKKSK